MQGCIWHHHFCATIDAVRKGKDEKENRKHYWKQLTACCLKV